MALRLLGMTCLSRDRDRPFRCKVYARVEAYEEPNSDQEPAEDTLIAFDAVSADWIDSPRDSFFAFDEGLEQRVTDYWKRMIEGKWRDTEDHYESVPVLHIELSLPSSNRWIRPLQELGDQWVGFDLDESGEYKVNVFRDPFDLEPEDGDWISDAPRPVSENLSDQSLLSNI